MKYKYTNVIDNCCEVEKFSDKEAEHFPLGWFEKHPADEGGDSMLQTTDQVLEIETRDFEDTSIRINLSNSVLGNSSWDEMNEAETRRAMATLGLQSRAVKDLVQKFMNDLLELGICNEDTWQCLT